MVSLAVDALVMVPIVGCQRSGTTLVAEILGSHPHSLLIEEGPPATRWYRAALGSASSAHVAAKFRLCCRLARKDYREPANRVGWSGSVRGGISHVVLKAPNLTYSSEAIGSVWPSAPIIYLQRDIRAVVASALSLSRVPIADNQLRLIRDSDDMTERLAEELEVLERLGTDVAPHLKMALVARMKMSLADQFRQHGLQVLQVKYESLVAEPEIEIPRMLSHVGLQPADECFRHETVLVGSGPGDTVRERSIDTRSVQSWETKLTPRQADQIWDLVGDFMESMGYSK